jgi:hypothetical protein
LQKALPNVPASLPLLESRLSRFASKQSDEGVLRIRHFFLHLSINDSHFGCKADFLNKLFQTQVEIREWFFFWQFWFRTVATKGIWKKLEKMAKVSETVFNIKNTGLDSRGFVFFQFYVLKTFAIFPKFCKFFLNLHYLKQHFPIFSNFFCTHSAKIRP